MSTSFEQMELIQKQKKKKIAYMVFKENYLTMSGPNTAL